MCFSATFQLYIATLASGLLVLRPPPLPLTSTHDLHLHLGLMLLTECIVLYYSQYIQANLHKENTLASNDVMYVYYFYSDV